MLDRGLYAKAHYVVIISILCRETLGYIFYQKIINRDEQQ